MVDAERAIQPRSNASTYSFHTAKTKPSEHVLETVDEMDVDESMPNSIMNSRSCAECEDAKLSCSTTEGILSCSNCIDMHKQCSFDLDGTMSFSDMDISEDLGTPASSRDTPQHERWLAETIGRSRSAPRMLSFETGDANDGDAMAEIADSDLYYWIDIGPKLVVQAHNSTSVAKRMFHELKLIRKAHVPFVSATPVGDDLGKILASIEGPPDTAYQGGIFWILVTASQKTPPGAPTLRFHTKIYHPNIDPRTRALCADYEQKWNPSKVPPSLRGHFAESTALWSQRTSPDMWSLLALLIAICGLLASPNVHDPLVPEIAQKYVEDPEGFHEAAKLWTQRYATSPKKPDEESLRFIDENATSGPARSEGSSDIAHIDCGSEVRDDPSAVQDYWRQKFEDKLITNSVDPVSPGSSGDRVQSDTTDSERKIRTSRVEDIVDSFLHRDAQQNRRLKQIAGGRLSDIEQWRMVRDLRLELEKRLYQKRSAVPFAIISCPRPIAEFDLRSKIVGRVQFIKEEPESQYFTYVDLLKRSFSQTRMSASSRRPSHSSKAGNPRTSTIQRTTVCTSSNGKRASWSSPRWEKKQKLSSSSAQPVSVESHNASEDDSGNLNDSNLNKLTGTPESKPGAQFRGQYNYHPNYQYNSPTPRRPQQRNSPYFGASSGEPNKNANEYVDYLIDGVIYRAYNSQTKRSGYRYRGHGAARDSDYRLCSPYYFSLNAKLPPTYGSAAHIHRGDPEYDFVMHEGKVCPKPKQWEQPSYNDAPCRRRRSSTPARPYTQPAQSKKAPLTRKATEEDARRHRIPPGYSIKNWDPTEEPIMLLGSVFDANSLGKWIYDWTVYHHGPATPIADMSGELWLLLIQLAGKVKRAEESIDRVRRSEDKEMVDDFIESGERLFNKLKKLLKSCQEPMLKAGKKKGNDSAQLGKNAGTEFVDSIFGRDRQLEATEKFMASIRLWNLRFDANCEDILRNLGGASLPPYGEERSNDGWKSHPSKKSDVDDTIVLSPVSIRTAFGLEAIPENRRIT